MDYGVQVGDLSEKVKGEVAVIASPARLDEKSWVDAIHAISVIAGHLEFSGLMVKTDTLYDMYTEADLPVTIPCGLPVFAAVLYYNDDPYAAHDLTCVVEFIDPDGVSVGKATVTERVSAGGHKTASTLEITLDKAGTWEVHAVLSD